MKRALGAVFAVALVAIPAWGIARTSVELPYLSCVASYPVVSMGFAGRFHVVTNVNGPFMWVATDEDYGVHDAGAEFVTPFTHVGQQQVSVVWGSKRSSCYVEVVPAPGFGEPYLGQTPIYGGPVHSDYGYSRGPNVTLTSVAYPSLPNAGFEPQTLSSLAFAVVLLLGATIALYPHARKAFAIVTR